jgi:DNA-binding NarL/FixJ family response regulator
MSVRVLIADDQQLVRAGFRMILGTQPDIEVVGEATSGTEAIAITAALHPDVVLMDIRMPGIDGIEATRRILADGREPPARVLMLTTFDLDEYVYDALRAGASGFLLKDVPPHQLAAAVRTVGDGDALLSPTITRRLIEEFAVSRTPRGTPRELGELSPRELEVFQLLARGMSNREIADHLIIGETTIKTHVTRILTKLGVRDRVQAVVLAYETGAITPGQPQ